MSKYVYRLHRCVYIDVEIEADDEDGERKLVLRWLPPTMVNVKGGIEAATIHRVAG